MSDSSSDDDSFECDTCTRRFATSRACNQHMDATNHRAPTFDCEVCHKTFRTQPAANQHMDAVGHWEQEYYPYECDTCTNRYTSEAAVQKHMKDAGHYKYYCKACERKFENKNNLNMVRLIFYFPVQSVRCKDLISISHGRSTSDRGSM